MHRKLSVFFYWLAGFLFLNLFFARAIMQGMFFDGVTYAVISRNLAQGIGTMYEPCYLGYNFYEHPPLLFILQSFFFMLFGDHWWVEKLYALLLFCANVYFVSKIWIASSAQAGVSKITSYYYLPCVWILFFVVRSILWGATYNLLDSQMLFFDLLAVFFLQKFLFYRRSYLFLFLSSLSIALAFYTKGPVGLFPLCFLFWYMIVFEKNNYLRFVFYIILHILSTFFCLILPLLHEKFRFSFLQYMQQQIFASLRGERAENYTENFKYLRPFAEILQEHLVSLLLVLLVYLLFRKHLTIQKIQKQGVLFLFVALSASLPTGLSYKQSGMYLIPSAPFFTISALFFITAKVNSISFTLPRLFKKFVATLPILFAINFLILLPFVGAVARDRKLLELTEFLTKSIPQGSTLYASSVLYRNPSLEAYLERFGHFLLTNQAKTDYYLFEPTEWEESCNSFPEHEILFTSPHFVLVKTKEVTPSLGV